MLLRLITVFSLILLAVPVYAVYLNPAGRGQALIFSYYTVRAGYNTYFSITNTDWPQVRSIVAKVRFREGRNGRVVSEFNLYLNPGDVWTAALGPTADGTRLVTTDRSCTDPPIPSNGLTFSNAAYANENDRAGTALERTREGYVEVIEMGSSLPIVQLNPSTSQFNCAEVINLLQGLNPPTSSLAGQATLINVNTGFDAGYAADALAALTSAPFFTRPGQPGSDFDSPEVDPISHTTIANFSYRLVWNRGIDAVNAALASEYFDNEFVLDPQVNARTDWVITLPTKRFFVTPTSSQRPFTAVFPPTTEGTQCEGVLLETFNRELQSQSIGGFPERPASATRTCWAATAFSIRASADPIPVGNSDVLGSTNTMGWTAELLSLGSAPPPGGVNLPASFINGHSMMRFDGLGFYTSLPSSSWTDLRTGQTGTGSVDLYGYPAVGFSIRVLVNDALACGETICQRNYASAFPYRRMTRYFRQTN